MSAGADVFKDDGFEVAAGDAVVIEENVVAVLGEVLKDGERAEGVGAAVADEDGFFDASHGAGWLVPHSQ